MSHESVHESIPKAVVFDVDGLLVDSDDLTFVVVQDALWHDFGKRLTKEVFSRYFGMTRQHFIEAISEHYELGSQERQLFAEVRNNLHYEAVELKPGAKELLHYLEEQGIPCALATNGVPGSLAAKLDHLQVKHYFSHILSTEIVQRPKPEPDIYLEMAKRLKLAPQDLLVLEDSRIGVEAAMTAESPVYFVPNHYVVDPIHFAREHHVLLFTNLHAVLEHLKHLKR